MEGISRVDGKKETPFSVSIPREVSLVGVEAALLEKSRENVRRGGLYRSTSIADSKSMGWIPLEAGWPSLLSPLAWVGIVGVGKAIDPVFCELSSLPAESFDGTGGYLGAGLFALKVSTSGFGRESTLDSGFKTRWLTSWGG